MNIEQLINVLVTITLIQMMVAVGLMVTIADLTTAAQNWRLLLRAALANYICVPAATVFLLSWADARPMVAAAFLILAVCPGAPYGPPLTAVAKGDVRLAVGLMVLLAGSSALVAPITLPLLMPLALGRNEIPIGAGQIAVTLLATQLLPLCVGISVRQWWPDWAERAHRPANLASKVLNVLVIGLIIIVHGHLLAEIKSHAFICMAILLLVSWTVGWLFGGLQSNDRRTLAVTTSLRNFGLGLVIATSAFAGTPAVTAIVAYGLLSLFGTAAFAMLASLATQRRAGCAVPP